jgi:hypothetical protein
MLFVCLLPYECPYSYFCMPHALWSPLQKWKKWKMNNWKESDEEERRNLNQ